jgi:hypothetical protein
MEFGSGAVMTTKEEVLRKIDSALFSRADREEIMMRKRRLV